MSEQTPRINARYLEKFVNHTVRIVGKVTELYGDSAKIDASGTINLILTRECHMTVGNGVELVGKVQPTGDVKVLSSWDLGPDVDYNIADAVVDATHRYKDLFYDV
ncbi:replication factor A protein 3 [Sphaerosporella brunnea]|uniref:Replication factor A protein 3 n=1 Tax=Sphaerosporella brunnea TaxID=1250544 RepID=A0A5J5ESF7_9PEZI|nr:replication factor A protein 3 [Sphaerosporella brunnea]